MGGKWTADEDATLMAHAPNWAHLLTLLPSRTYGSVTGRPNKLLNQKDPNRKKIRRIVPSNVRGYTCVNMLVQRAIASAMDKAKSRARGKAWYEENAERHLANGKKRYDNDPQAKIKKTTAHGAKARKENPTVRLAHNCRMRLQVYFKNGRFKKDAKTSKLIGMSFPKLMKRLCEMAGIVEMTEDHHVDHIFPLARYGLHEEHKMMHYSNLQLLLGKENQHKSMKLPTKAMAAKVDRNCWPDGITEDMLPDIYPGWRTPLRM
jgi:5-methylcytosine-specific restriction endonuclease McrA